MTSSPLLEIRGLRVSFATRGGELVAVDGIDLTVDANETLAIVGESGSRSEERRVGKECRL